MSNNICIHAYVTGKVQGVWFRASTRAEAERLNLTGWVRNLSDGRVEVMACGPQVQIEALCEWLRQGPKMAKVSEVVCEEVEWRAFSGFDVV